MIHRRNCNKEIPKYYRAGTFNDIRPDRSISVVERRIFIVKMTTVYIKTISPFSCTRRNAGFNSVGARDWLHPTAINITERTYKCRNFLNITFGERSHRGKDFPHGLVMKQMRRPIFGFLRTVLVLLTGRGYDRAPWMNDLHHKLSFRLHKLLPKFGITGIQRVPVPGMPGRFIYVRAEDGGVAHQLIMYREYEPFESSLIRTYLKPGMIVYNIGANLGYYTLVASECNGRNGKVYAFEPAPENFELLTRTISENKLTNVELFRAPSEQQMELQHSR